MCQRLKQLILFRVHRKDTGHNQCCLSKCNFRILKPTDPFNITSTKIVLQILRRIGGSPIEAETLNRKTRESCPTKSKQSMPLCLIFMMHMVTVNKVPEKVEVVVPWRKAV